jgi:hypothetical protein
MEQIVDLGEARIDPDHARRPLGQQIVPEAAAPVHLDHQAAEVAQGFLTRFQEDTAFAPENPGTRPTWGDPVVPGPLLAPEGHPAGV